MRALPVLALLAASCGGGDDSPPATPDAAAGSGTLLISGALVAQNPDNLADGTDLRVDCEVRLARAGAPLGAAQVIVLPATGFQTVLVEDLAAPGTYRGAYFGYAARSARLSVSAGGDYLGQTPVGGPQVFQIEQPAAGAQVDAGAALAVVWSRPDAADTVTVATLGGHRQEDLADSGAAEVPASALTGATDDAVTVIRLRRAPLGAGAAAGSQLDFGVATTQPFQVK